jgi:hypothetical protein
MYFILRGSVSLWMNDESKTLEAATTQDEKVLIFFFHIFSAFVQPSVLRSSTPLPFLFSPIFSEQARR